MGKPIKVGFIMQLPGIWDKVQPVFEAMIDDDRFAPLGIVVPGYEGYDIGVRPFGAWGQEWKYFHELYPNQVIDAVDEQKNILDLRALKLDYVFYQRPYEILLPAGLRAQYVKQFARVCYVPYGAFGAKVFENFSLRNGDFFSSIYYYFAPSEHLGKLIMQYFTQAKVKVLGYPSFEKFLADNENSHEIRKNKRILWTPRWSYDPVIGGSHFLEYKDELISFKQAHTQLPMKVRPHPLMQGELINKGVISESEWEAYQEALKLNDIVYDSEKTVNAALHEADILLTDFSTIMPMFFMMDKPIIYCPAPNIELNADYERMIPGLYTAENWEDIEVLLKFLGQGMDIKKLKRKEIIGGLLREHIGATERILNCLTENLT